MYEAPRLDSVVVVVFVVVAGVVALWCCGRALLSPPSSPHRTTSLPPSTMLRRPRQALPCFCLTTAELPAFWTESLPATSVEAKVFVIFSEAASSAHQGLPDPQRWLSPMGRLFSRFLEPEEGSPLPVPWMGVVDCFSRLPMIASGPLMKRGWSGRMLPLTGMACGVDARDEGACEWTSVRCKLDVFCHSPKPCSSQRQEQW